MGHEGNLQGGKAAAVVNRMLQKKELPKLREGFSRVTLRPCQYKDLSPTSNLPQGCFGQKSEDAIVQVGIMKFLKKVDASPGVQSKETGIRDVSRRLRNLVLRRMLSLVQVLLTRKKSQKRTSWSAPLTMIFVFLHFVQFQSHFQFNLDKASDVIVEKVGEFIDKLGNAKLYLVDLTRGSKILSLVTAKASKKNIDSSKFFTFVGDIVHLSAQGGLRCNVIANAANCAAGPDMEVATYERAKTLLPGKALAVPLPSTSPLSSWEGVTHVILVLGPNMNPQRPNCLNGDYNEGCKNLCQAYTELFEGFLSISSSLKKSTGHGELSHPSESGFNGDVGNVEQRNKRDGEFASTSSRMSRRPQVDAEHDVTNSEPRGNDDTPQKVKAKGWGSWAQALHQTAMHPERHPDVVMEVSDDVVVINDLYPKAEKHILILARMAGLDSLADVHEEHLEIVTKLHSTGLKWVEKSLRDDASLVFCLGYHSVPSMRQLHLHVISQDFNSPHLKNKKHWKSFNTAFFQDSVDVIEEVAKSGKSITKHGKSLLSMELQCHRCRSARPNIPRLKSYVRCCRAPFPASLHRNGRLVQDSTST